MFGKQPDAEVDLTSAVWRRYTGMSSLRSTPLRVLIPPCFWGSGIQEQLAQGLPAGAVKISAGAVVI